MAEPVEALLSRVQATRAQVDAFVASAAPRKRRLLNTTIVGGAMAAALTAVPAVGGAPVTSWLTAALGLESPVWRLLCGAASLSSVAATIATTTLKTTHLEEHLARGLACRARLEAIETGLALGHVDLRQATTDYLKCVEDAAVIGAS
jgi:MFS family permease